MITGSPCTQVICYGKAVILQVGFILINKYSCWSGFNRFTWAYNCFFWRWVLFQSFFVGSAEYCLILFDQEIYQSFHLHQWDVDPSILSLRLYCQVRGDLIWLTWSSTTCFHWSWQSGVWRSGFADPVEWVLFVLTQSIFLNWLLLWMRFNHSDSWENWLFQVRSCFCCLADLQITSFTTSDESLTNLQSLSLMSNDEFFILNGSSQIGKHFYWRSVAKSNPFTDFQKYHCWLLSRWSSKTCFNALWWLRFLWDEWIECDR